MVNNFNSLIYYYVINIDKILLILDWLIRLYNIYSIKLKTILQNFLGAKTIKYAFFSGKIAIK